jgi:hypothetical protein
MRDVEGQVLCVYGEAFWDHGMRCQALEDENAKLKKLLDEQMRGMAAMKELLSKMVMLVVKREAFTHMRAQLRLSERRAYEIAGADGMIVQYRAERTPHMALRGRLRALANVRGAGSVNSGFWCATARRRGSTTSTGTSAKKD